VNRETTIVVTWFSP